MIFDHLCLPKLESLEYGGGSFIRMKDLSFSLEGIWYLIIWYFDLPNLQSFKTGDKSFQYTESLSLSSMIIKFDILILTFSNLPNLLSIEIGKESFEQARNICLESNSHQFDTLTF